MKKAYLAYLVVFGIAAVIGTALLVKKVNEMKANLTALEVSTTQVETAISNIEASQVAEAGPVSTGIAQAAAARKAAAEETARVQKELAALAIPKPPEKPTPAPKLPGAGASIDVGGAPSCADLGNLKQAVNPNPRATQYEGQLLIGAGTGAKQKPCTRARTFGNTGSPSSGALGKMPSGEYVHPTLGKFSVGRR